MGRLIRHAGRRTALPVRTLTVPMIEPALRTLLVAPIGGAMLPASSFRSASRAAITLSAVTLRANPEQRLASVPATNSRPDNDFSLNRHPPTLAAFDNGNGSWQGGTSLMVTFTRGLPSENPAASHGGVLYRLQSPYNLPLECFGLTIGLMIAPSARMMSPYSRLPAKFRKLRFLMTDDRRLLGSRNALMPPS